MALILNIDTASSGASIALSNQGNVIGIKKNADVKDHASWIHNAVQNLLRENGSSISELQAIAVTAGPGSYTGLRVGMATAKGLCYVLNIPLIVENTLKVMAMAAIQIGNRQQVPDAPGGNLISRVNTENGKTQATWDAEAQVREASLKPLLVPMIDARRMEVFTAVYDFDLSEIMSPVALVLDPAAFDAVASGRRLICFGNGSEKFQTIARPGQFEFQNWDNDAGSLAFLSYEKFRQKEFADLAYVEPLYLKEFYSPSKK